MILFHTRLKAECSTIPFSFSLHVDSVDTLLLYSPSARLVTALVKEKHIHKLQLGW